MTNFRLPFDDSPSDSAGQGQPEPVESRIDARDRAGRERAVDPRFNVALEASAGTGKTRVLVDRYVNLLKAGVDPGEFSRSPSPARPPPRCASGLSRRCAMRPRAVRFRATLARAARPHGRHRPSARSTRSVCRCCASSRSRPTSIPDSRWPTKPKCRGWSTSRSIARCASAAVSPATTSTSRSCSRSSATAGLAPGLAALLDRRIVAPRSCRGFSRQVRAI